MFGVKFVGVAEMKPSVCTIKVAQIFEMSPTKLGLRPYMNRISKIPSILSLAAKPLCSSIMKFATERFVRGGWGGCCEN